MLICHCRAVYERQIRDLVRSGAGSRAEVARASRASTACGGCTRAVERIIRDEQRSARATAPPPGLAAAAR